MVELLVTEDNPTGADVIAKILAEASPDFVEYVRKKVGEKFTERTIFRDQFSGYWQTPHQAISAEVGRLNGLYINIEDSPYLYINLGDAELFIGTAGAQDETLRLIDLDRGTVIETFEFDATNVGDFVRIPLSKKYFGYRRLFLGYRSEISSIRTTVHGRSLWGNFCEPCNCSSWARCASLDLAEPLTFDRLDYSGECGLRLCYGIGCSLDGWLCNNRARFAQPFKYHSALFLLEEITASDKLNTVTNMSDDEFNALYGRASERMDRGVSNIVDGTSFDCRYCFPCNKKKTKKAYFLP
jgi:hypothetical protein